MAPPADRVMAGSVTVARTYELYLCDPAGERSFEALTCNRLDMVSRAREVMEQRGAASVEIWEAGEHLITLAA